MVINENDPFGLAIWEYYHGEKTEEHARFGCKTWFSEYEDWPNREQKAIKLAKGKVLDIGCAAGRHSIYLQAKNLEVMAIDNSPLAMDICKKRGVVNAKCLSIHQVSNRLGIYDTILMLGNNFGLTGNPKRCKWILRSLFKMTTEKGRIIK